MESVGLRGEIDHLGRIHIPKKVRELYGMDGEVELVLTPEGVCLRSPRFVLTAREEET